MDIPWTLGAYEFGVLFGTILYGIVVAQCFTYMREKFMDSIWLKAVVGIVCLLDTVHTVSIWALLYYWSVNNFGNDSGLVKIKWMFILAFALSPTLGAIVQSFFAYRMFLLLSKPFLPIIIWIGAAARVGFSVVRIVVFARSKTIPQLVQHYSWVLSTTLSINVALDTLNTGGLLYCLLRNRKNVRRSRKTLDKLLRYTVEIGLTTVICATITLGLVHYRAHQNYIFVAFFVMYPKLFTNTLLASLNARAEFRRDLTTVMSDICIAQENHTDDHLLDTTRIAHETASPFGQSPSSEVSSFRVASQTQSQTGQA